MSNKFIETINSSNNATIYISTTAHTPYYIADDKIPHDAAVRTNRGGLEYYDGNHHCWLPLPGADVKLEVSPHLQIVLDWAYRKMDEEQKMETLIAKYPALKTAKENFDLIKALVQHEST